MFEVDGKRSTQKEEGRTRYCNATQRNESDRELGLLLARVMCTHFSAIIEEALRSVPSLRPTSTRERRGNETIDRLYAHTTVSVDTSLARGGDAEEER